MVRKLFKLLVAALIFSAVGCNISGKVTDTAGNPMMGVTVTLTGADEQVATTDGNGKYTFTDLSQGSYTVTPSLPETFFTPASKSVKLSLSNVTANFTQYIPPEPPEAPLYDLTGNFLFRVESPVAASMGGGAVFIQAYIEQTGNQFTMELADYENAIITGTIDGVVYTGVSFPETWVEMAFGGGVLIDVKFKSMLLTALDDDSVDGQLSIAGKYMEIPVTDTKVTAEGYRN